MRSPARSSASSRADAIRLATGWLTVAVATAITSLWAFWGIVETFHEGWFHESLAANVGSMLGQYLLPAFGFLALSVVSLRWPRAGAALHLAAAGGVLWFFRGASLAVLLPFLALPLVILGAGWGWGRPRPKRWAARIALGVPILVLVASGVEPAIRVAGRIDDGDRGLRRVTGNGVDLLWAPEGPGWPREGVTWEEAKRRCRFLSPDGTALEDAPRDLWRLPTVDEAVRSQHRHGANAGGAWDPAARTTRYERLPDKEPPLWDPRSQVIYWWTSTEANDREAFIVVYNGTVWPRTKTIRPGSLGFRAVRAAD